MKHLNNQPALFLQPAPGTDCGLQTDDLGHKVFYQSLPTEATSNAAKILHDHEALKARLGNAYNLFVERELRNKTGG